MKQTVALIFGGSNSEYGVSLQSSAAVMRAIDTNRYTILPLGITRQGQWLYFPGSVEEIEADRWWQNPACTPAVFSPSSEDHGVWLIYESGALKKTIDIAFPVLHGKNGEDGSVQGLLQLAGIPFVGCGCMASAVCMDKDIAHRLALHAGVACPEYTTLYAANITGAKALRSAAEDAARLGFPLFVKPAREGSSFGVSRVENLDELQAAIQTALRYDSKIVVEKAVEGFEVGCSVLGNTNHTLGTPDAIQLQKGFFDYHEKYNRPTAKIVLPAPLSPQDLRRCQQTALHLYQVLGCTGFARVDMFFTPEGEIVFNEVNTIPGLTANSRYPAMLGDVGVSFEDMVAQLLKLAVAA